VTNSSNLRVPEILIFSFILFFGGVLCSSAEDIYHPLKPTFLTNGSYCEAYKLSALLDDETFIETEMMVTNIGFRDSNAACQILVLHPGEGRWKASKRFGKAEWNYLDTPNPALSIGHCRLTQEKDSTVCTMAFGNATVTLFFKVVPNPVKTPATINAGVENPLHHGKSSSDRKSVV
jgi:hypothetical protein